MADEQTVNFGPYRLDAVNAAFTYKGKAVKIEDIGRELGVRYVLEGSVREAGLK